MSIRKLIINEKKYKENSNWNIFVAKKNEKNKQKVNEIYIFILDAITWSLVLKKKNNWCCNWICDGELDVSLVGECTFNYDGVWWFTFSKKIHKIVQIKLKWGKEIHLLNVNKSTYQKN